MCTTNHLYPQIVLVTHVINQPAILVVGRTTAIRGWKLTNLIIIHNFKFQNQYINLYIK